MTGSSNPTPDDFNHKVRDIDQPIIFFGYNVIDIITGGMVFIIVTQLLLTSVPDFPGSSVVAFFTGLASGYGYLSAGQYLREYAPPNLIAYLAYWARSGDHYQPQNDTFPMPLVPTDLINKDNE